MTVCGGLVEAGVAVWIIRWVDVYDYDEYGGEGRSRWLTIQGVFSVKEEESKRKTMTIHVEYHNKEDEGRMRRRTMHVELDEKEDEGRRRRRTMHVE